MESEPSLAYRQKRRFQSGGNGCAALLVLLIGLGCLLVFWPLGLLLMVLGLAMDTKYAWQSFCGACGNDVSPTSQQCPHCRFTLVPETLSMRLRRFGWGLIVALVFCAGTLAFFFWFFQRQSQP